MRKLILISLILILGIACYAQDSYFYSGKTTDSSGKERYELFNKEGKSILNQKYDWIYVNHWYWIIAIQDKQRNAYDTNGVRFNIDGIQQVYSIWRNSLYQPIKINDLWAYYDRSGKLIIDHEFDDVTLFKNGMAAVKKKNKTFYINEKGKKLKTNYVPNSDYEFMQVESAVGMFTFSNSPQLVFEENGKMGLKEKGTDKIIIECQYDGFYNITKDQVTVQLGNKYGVIDFKGKIILPFVFDEIFVFD